MTVSEESGWDNMAGESATVTLLLLRRSPSAQSHCIRLCYWVAR